MKMVAGCYENVEFVGPIYKDRLLKKYPNRLEKIWISRLSDYNKVTSYNCFVVLFIAPSIGVLNWSTNNIKQIDL